MVNLLQGSFMEKYGVLLIFVVAFIFICFINYSRSKQYMEAEDKMISELKVGADVKTKSGMYGKIHAINETKDGKIAVLETDSGALISFDIRAIYSVVDRTIIEEDDLDADLVEVKEPAKEDVLSDK